MTSKTRPKLPSGRSSAVKVTPAAGSVQPAIPGWLTTTSGWTWRLLVLGLGIVVVFVAVAQVKLVFIALFLALVLTSVLRPVVNFLDRFMPRALATIVSLAAGLSVVAGMIWYVINSVISQWDSLTHTFAVGLDRMFDFFENGPLPVTVTSDQFEQWLTDGVQWLQDNAGNLAGTAVSQAGSVFRLGTSLALAVFCLVFFLLKGKSMWAWFLNQLPASARPHWNQAGAVGWYTFSGYARGTVIITTLNAIFAGIFITIVGVPLAAPLAVLIFIGGFIPLIGAPAAMVTAMIVALASHGFVMAGVVGIGIALLGQLEGNVFQPLIMGKQVSLHPVIVAISVTAGTLLAGLLGAVIAVPIVAVTWAVFAAMRTVDPPTAQVAEIEAKPWPWQRPKATARPESTAE